MISSKKSFTTIANGVDFLLMHKEVDVETISSNYKKLAAFTHPDVGGCEDLLKTIYQISVFSINDKATETCNKWGLEKTQEELSRNIKWEA